MIEIVFSENVAGSMTVAMGSVVGGAVGVAILREDGKKPSKWTLWRAKRKAEREIRENWKDSVALEGDRGDILCFPLGLSVGGIREECPGEERFKALELLACGRREAAELLEKGRESLERLLDRAKAGETLRIWSSGEPDEACGLCWVLDRLRPLGLEKLKLILVKLPETEEQRDGVVVRYRGWGDVGPQDLGRLALTGKELSPEEAEALADRWRVLWRENGALRAVENGIPVSVGEDHYDRFLLEELEGQPERFREAVLIGNVLGKYRLGIGDGFVHSRVEALVEQGVLEAVTVPEAGDVVYRRELRKKSSP